MSEDFSAGATIGILLGILTVMALLELGWIGGC